MLTGSAPPFSLFEICNAARLSLQMTFFTFSADYVNGNTCPRLQWTPGRPNFHLPRWLQSLQAMHSTAITNTALSHLVLCTCGAVVCQFNLLHWFHKQSLTLLLLTDIAHNHTNCAYLNLDNNLKWDILDVYQKLPFGGTVLPDQVIWRQLPSSVINYSFIHDTFST